MKLNNKTFLYYVHIPSTGGVFLKKKLLANEKKVQWYGKGSFKYDHHPCALKNPIVFKGSRNHADSYLKDENYTNENSLSFAAVRNPFDQYVTSYLISKKNKEFDNDFDYFIKMTCCPAFKVDKNLGESFYLSRNFLFYQIFKDDHNCAVDIILRREKLNDGLMRLFIATGIHKNYDLDVEKNYVRDYRTFYKDDLVDIVMRKRYQELKKFGYTFENLNNYNHIIDTKNLRHEVNEQI
tara:strand:+ start:3059 stop:3772 length:714 start_codon:yes stop_codon:yes gene_type:complete